MSVLALRIIACVAMLIDHIGYQYNIMAFRLIGRIAFPIFVYLLCNGYRYTSNRGWYALRLGLFALLSQIPFSLFCYGRLWDGNGNVMFTLLASLLCIWSAEELRAKRGLRLLAFAPTVLVCLMYLLGIVHSDYGARGILMALVFFYCDGKKLVNRVLMVLGMFVAVYHSYFLSMAKRLLLFALGSGLHLPQVNRWDAYQAFSLLALIFIFCYNGKKGTYPQGKLPAGILQYGFYAFYPVHQLVLWLIRVL